MPSPRKATSRARDRCAYVESGRRCVFAGKGTGDVVFCAAHAMVVEEMSKPKGTKPGDGVGWLFGKIFQGQRVTRADVESVIAGEAERMAEHMGWGFPGTQPEPDGSSPEGFDGDHVHNEPRQPPPGRGWRERVNDAVNRHRDPEAPRRARARQVLGFPVGCVLTVEQIRGAHRQLAKKWHPDKHPTNPVEATRRMTEINVAADILLAEIKS